jgi:hypothetical protein
MQWRIVCSSLHVTDYSKSSANVLGYSFSKNIMPTLSLTVIPTVRESGYVSLPEVWTSTSASGDCSRFPPLWPKQPAINRQHISVTLELLFSPPKGQLPRLQGYALRARHRQGGKNGDTGFSTPNTRRNQCGSLSPTDANSAADRRYGRMNCRFLKVLFDSITDVNTIRQ